jgi:hypothetical protein
MALRAKNTILNTLDTLKALVDITDEGLFERLATAVLRVAHPLCAGLSQPGVNEDGKTRKGPLDAIAYVSGANPPHLIAVQHTTTDINNLAKRSPSTTWRAVRSTFFARASSMPPPWQRPRSGFARTATATATFWRPSPG